LQHLVNIFAVRHAREILTAGLFIGKTTDLPAYSSRIFLIDKLLKPGIFTLTESEQEHVEIVAKNAGSGKAAWARRVLLEAARRGPGRAA
jgi:hypothetical protein